MLPRELLIKDDDEEDEDEAEDGKWQMINDYVTRSV
jgi:hypothetical protein